MSHVIQNTKSVLASEKVAGSKTVTFDTRKGTQGAAVQLNVVESCLCNSVFLDECVNVCTDVVTETAHGFATGLKGTLSVQIGCAKLTPSACISTACNLITEAAHCFTAGERGRFTTSCTLPSFCGCVISACTDFFIIDLSACTYNVATTRALALAGCGVCITGAGVGNQTFTPNGAIPTGLSTCASASFIIKVDDDSYKVASSKANAEAGTANNITALQSPASVTFTPAAGDATSGTITYSVSVDGTNFVPNACLINGTIPCAITINACVGCGTIDRIDVLTNTFYNIVQVDVDVTDSQWTVDLVALVKE